MCYPRWALPICETARSRGIVWYQFDFPSCCTYSTSVWGKVFLMFKIPAALSHDKYRAVISRLRTTERPGAAANAGGIPFVRNSWSGIDGEWWWDDAGSRWLWRQWQREDQALKCLYPKSRVNSTSRPAAHGGICQVIVALSYWRSESRCVPYSSLLNVRALNMPHFVFRFSGRMLSFVLGRNITSRSNTCRNVLLLAVKGGHNRRRQLESRRIGIVIKTCQSVCLIKVWLFGTFVGPGENFRLIRNHSLLRSPVGRSAGQNLEILSRSWIESNQ
jgi:hypothetical protein